jgi:glycosyltransferase involved in cell wall biosynthesis
MPYPPHQGTSLRNYHIIRGLARRHQITLLSFRESVPPLSEESTGPLQDLCQQIVTVPLCRRGRWRRLLQLLTSTRPDIAFRLHSQAMVEAAVSILKREQFDIAQIEGLEMAFLATHLRATQPAIRLVYDSHNAETAIQRLALTTDRLNPSRWPAAVYSLLQIRRLERFERWTCRYADHVTVVSDQDKRSLRTVSAIASAKMTVIPNCIDLSDYWHRDATLKGSSSQARAGERLTSFDLLFSGKMDYRPNVDAVLWFAESIWPRIRAERPAATWAIVGQSIHPRLRRLAKLEGVTMTGRVERVQPYLAGALVYIMPFRIGSGTRLKLLEAMASGLPIVSTSIGAEGYEVADGRELRLADASDEFATAVLYLLDNAKERSHLSRAGDLFVQKYDWRQVVPRFEDVYEKLN